MIISGEQLCMKLGQAMLKGYFLGVEEERKRGLNRRQRRIYSSKFKHRSTKVPR